MDRNAIIGMILIFMILVYMSWYGSQTPVDTDRTGETVERTIEPGTARDTRKQETAVEEQVKREYPEGFAHLYEGDDETIILENEHLEIGISTRGGRPVFTRLKNYLTYQEEPLLLFDEGQWQFEYVFFGWNHRFNTADINFEAAGVTQGPEGSSIVTMRANIAEGSYFEQVYTIHPNSYMLDYNIHMVGMEDIIPRNVNSIELNWWGQLRPQEKNFVDEQNATTIYYRLANSNPDWLSESSNDQESLNQVKWVSFKQRFFGQTLIANDAFALANVQVNMPPADADYLKTMQASLHIPYNHTGNETFSMNLYLGPLHYQTLSQYGESLERQIRLGWLLFRWVNQGVIIPVFNFLSTFVGSYGLIILLMTLFIKLIILPFTFKSYVSQAKMRLLKGDFEELKKKYGDDMTKMQAEQMKLYRKAGVNPLGGCLPMLLQMPFLLAMFFFFPSSIELRQEGFLWANDLSTYDSILSLPFTIPFYGSHVSLFTILMAISTLFYAVQNSSMAPTQKELKFLPYIMPVFLLFFFNSYAAGLSYYYFLFNVISLGQNSLFKMYAKDEALAKKIEENKKKPESKKSSWQQRLEEMAKKQQEKQRAMQKETDKPAKRKR